MVFVAVSDEEYVEHVFQSFGAPVRPPVLDRYTDKQVYYRFKNAYIHNKPITNVKSRILTNK